MFLHIVGARPNFMKLSPVLRAMQHRNMECQVVHTGQHYDYQMSQVFFEDMNIPSPDIFLNTGKGTHAEQISAISTACEKLFLEIEPSAIIVYGDVNSTMSAALPAAN